MRNKYRAYFAAIWVIALLLPLSAAHAALVQVDYTFNVGTPTDFPGPQTFSGVAVYDTGQADANGNADRGWYNLVSHELTVDGSTYTPAATSLPGLSPFISRVEVDNQITPTLDRIIFVSSFNFDIDAVNIGQVGFILEAPASLLTNDDLAVFSDNPALYSKMAGWVSYGCSLGAGLCSTQVPGTFSISVVPLPGALWMLISALGALGWMRLRAS